MAVCPFKGCHYVILKKIIRRKRRHEICEQLLCPSVVCIERSGNNFLWDLYGTIRALANKFVLFLNLAAIAEFGKAHYKARTMFYLFFSAYLLDYKTRMVVYSFFLAHFSIHFAISVSFDLVEKRASEAKNLCS